MKFVIKKGSELYRKLAVIQARAIICNKDAKKLALFFGAKSWHIGQGCLAGGISCIEFKGDPPKGWVKFSPKYPNLFKPGARDKYTWKLIKMLPVVSSDEVAKILKFNDQTYFVGDQMHWISCPGVQWKKDFALVKVPEEVKYKPVPGMKEILESEFIKLSKLK